MSECLEGAAEAGMVRSYLDWLIELPWALPEEKTIDIPQARRIYEDHFGLEKIKSRIIEYLAVRKAGAARQGADPVFRRAAGSWQDVARAIDRTRDGSAVCQGQSGWRSMTRPKPGAIGGPTSAPCPAISFRQSRRPPLKKMSDAVVEKTRETYGGQSRYNPPPSQRHFDALKRILDRQEPDYAT